MDYVDFIRAEVKSSVQTNNIDAGFKQKDYEDRILSKVSIDDDADAFSFDAFEGVPVSNNEFTEVESHLIDEPLPLDYDTDEEIIIGEVRDVHGKLSDKVDSIMSASDVSVIPFETAGVLEQVVEFKRHDIVFINNNKYVMSRQLRESVVEQFKVSIIETLESGIPYMKILNCDMFIGTISYGTLMLSKAEWTRICSLFRRYNAKVYISKEGHLVLSVG